jgi:phosphoribosyl-ATP pyrophosphohydrolase
MSDSLGPVLARLWKTIESRRGGDPDKSHTARLFAKGRKKIAQKFGEESVEAVIEAACGNRSALVLESADVLYHLLVVWADAGLTPADIATELARREGVSGIEEKKTRTG